MAAPKTVPMKYIANLPKYQYEKPYQLIDIEQDPNDEIQATNLEYEFHQTLLLDLRARQPDLDLEKDSFKYVKHATKSKPSTSTDAGLAYCNEMMELLRQHIHTEKTLCYDMRIRSSAPQPPNEGGDFCAPPSMPGVPFQAAHVDHSRNGGLERVARHLTRQEKQKYFDGNWRIRIFNIWKPIVPVVDDMPLAICDPASLNEADLWETDQVGPDSTGEIYYLRPNTLQRWYWLPRQTDEELLIFLNWDSHPPDGKLTGCPHSAFRDPAAICGAPRESVEVRILAFTELNNSLA